MMVIAYCWGWASLGDKKKIEFSLTQCQRQRQNDNKNLKRMYSDQSEEKFVTLDQKPCKYI